MTMGINFLLTILLLGLCHHAVAFVSTLPHMKTTTMTARPFGIFLSETTSFTSAEEFFPEAEMIKMVLGDGHRPLGCTVEESMAVDDTHVFVSKVCLRKDSDANMIQLCEQE
jgi:hypothetical protein